MAIARALCLLICFSLNQSSFAEPAGPTIIPQLQERLGLSERQVRGALGALLVFVRERVPKPEFDGLAELIPNAEGIMQDVKQRGIVTGPLDNIDEYEASLASLGISESLASQFAPAVVEYLGAGGFTRERDMLARVLN